MIVRTILGDHNCSNPTLKEVCDSQWGNALYNKLFINVSETNDPNSGVKKYQVDDQLRSLITDDQRFMNIKHREAENKKMYAAFKFDTNHPDSLHVLPGDRRFLVTESEEKPLDSQFYGDLRNKWIKNEQFISQIYSHLVRCESPDQACPYGNAPMTARKQQLIASSRGAIDTMYDLIKADSCIEMVLQVDLAYLAFDKLKDEGNGLQMKDVQHRINGSINKHFIKLTTSGGEKKQVDLEGSRPTVWVVRTKNMKRYQNAGGKYLAGKIEESRRALYTMESRRKLGGNEQQSMSSDKWKIGLLVYEDGRYVTDLTDDFGLPTPKEVRDLVQKM